MKRGVSGLNMLVAVDKPEGMTSHDVVNRARRVFGERRVGHAGTLDPAATGVLLLGVGQGTRLMGLLTADKKSYLASICFGTQTSTDDAEGSVVRTAPIDDRICDEDYARSLLRTMLGEQMQTPPAFSAISVDGTRAYARARAGEEVELAPRKVTIYDASLVSIERDGDRVLWNCAFCVSKGTYVRAMARDLGIEANSAAHLSRLRRTSSGPITLRDCIDLMSLEGADRDQLQKVALDPVRALGLPVRQLTQRELGRVRNGNHLALTDQTLDEGALVSMVCDDMLWGVWKNQKGRLRPNVNFPQGISGVGAGDSSLRIRS